MATYQFLREINSDKLVSEIKAQNFAAPLEHLETEGLIVRVVFAEPLSETDQTTLADIVTNHQVLDIKMATTKRVQNAIQFGQLLVVEFGAMNTLAEKSSEEVLEMMTACRRIVLLLLCGSLHTSIDAIDALPPSELLPESVRAYFRNKIQDYLQIPRT